MLRPVPYDEDFTDERERTEYVRHEVGAFLLGEVAISLIQIRKAYEKP